MKHVIALTALIFVTACSFEMIDQPMASQSHNNMLEIIDQNGDHRVSYTEFVNHLSQDRDFDDEVRDEFGACDLNRDSHIILSEATNRACMEGADVQDFRAADSNSNQRVTLKEFRIHLIKHLFSQADTDNDRFLSASEIRSFN